MNLSLKHREKDTLTTWDSAQQTGFFSARPALFSTVIFLFFSWGFITLLNDLLIPVLKDELHLTYGKALLVQFSFFFTYFVMSLPTACMVNKVGYKKSIILGLLVIAVGALLFIPASLTLTYGLFLFALFVLSTGVVILQVSVNPLVTMLGEEKKASARLTLAQGLNSLGYVIAPLLLGTFAVVNMYIPYLFIAFVMIFVSLLISRFNFSFLDHSVEKQISETGDFLLWEHFPFVLGFLSIFFYVGAEVSAGSLIVNFFRLPEIGGLTLSQAVPLLSVYWGGAMVGRLVGAYILTKVNPSRVLSFCARANLFLSAGVIFLPGLPAGYCLLALGVYNSIMFPVLFSLSIAKLPSHVKTKASGFLIMAIVGGAVIPEIQGLIADAVGLQQSFVLLLASYLIIAVYGFYMRCSFK